MYNSREIISRWLNWTVCAVFVSHFICEMNLSGSICYTLVNNLCDM